MGHVLQRPAVFRHARDGLQVRDAAQGEPEMLEADNAVGRETAAVDHQFLLGPVHPLDRTLEHVHAAAEELAQRVDDVHRPERRAHRTSASIG